MNHPALTMTLCCSLQEIDAFVQEFLSVVQRLPSCISTLHALSRLPMPSTFSELQHFCSTNEAKFQQLRRSGRRACMRVCVYLNVDGFCLVISQMWLRSELSAHWDMTNYEYFSVCVGEQGAGAEWAAEALWDCGGEAALPWEGSVLPGNGWHRPLHLHRLWYAAEPQQVVQAVGSSCAQSEKRPLSSHAFTIILCNNSSHTYHTAMLQWSSVAQLLHNIANIEF